MAPNSNTTNIGGHVHVLIITALHKELRPAIRVFEAGRIPKTQGDTRQYYQATVKTATGTSYSIRLMTVGRKGSSYISAVLSDGIRRWQPRYVIVIGIAATIPGQGRRLTDVLVAEQIVDMSEFKIYSGKTEIRANTYPCEDSLVASVRDFLSGLGAPRPRVKCCIGTIISQANLVKSAQFRNWLVNNVKNLYEPIGIEMEGGGVGARIATLPKDSRPGFIVIKGACDYANYFKNDRAQTMAATRAAKFVRNFLAYGPLELKNEQQQMPEPVPTSRAGYLLSECLYDFAETIKLATKWFEGREFVFGTVEDFVRRCPSGYMRIVANAGLGKTAIAAALVQRGGVAAYFFFNASMGLTSPEAALNHLSAQLITTFNLPFDRVPQWAGKDSAFLSNLLWELARRRSGNEPIVIVLDALDEADPTPKGHNWMHLPDHLPVGIHIVVTHRPGDYPLSTRPGTAVNLLEIRWDDALQQKDVEQYLQRQAQRVEIANALRRATPPVTLHRFVALLKDRSEGNFMYLAYVLEDMASYEPGFSPLDVSKLPSGLIGYYEQFWNRMCGAPFGGAWTDWADIYESVLGILGTVEEPVTQEFIADLIGRSATEITYRCLSLWQRFLRHERRDKEETWWVVHRSFSDFLRTKVQTQSVHCKIAEYFSAPAYWYLHRGYALRHLSAHLEGAEMGDRLIELVEGPKWFESQKKYDSTLTSYAIDVERALRLAEKRGIDGLASVVALSLLSATLRSRADLVPLPVLEALVALGELDKAVNYANSFTSPTQSAAALRCIAVMLHKTDHTAQAREFLRHAREVTLTIPMAAERVDALVNLAEILATVGEKASATEVLHDAEATSDHIQDHHSLVSVLTYIALLTSKVEGLQQGKRLFHLAQTVANSISDPFNQGETCVRLADAVARAGDTAHAQELLYASWDIAAAVESESTRGKLLREVALGLGRVGKAAEARRVAAEIADDSLRKETSRALIKALGDTGAILEAVVEAECIDSPDELLEARIPLCRALGRSGHTVLALDILHQVEVSYLRVKDFSTLKVATLIELGLAMHDLGEDSKATSTLSLAEQLAASGRKDSSLERKSVIEALLEIGNPIEAWSLARTMGPNHISVELLASIARDLALTGDVGDARKALQEALTTPRGMKALGIKPETLAAIGTALVDAQDIDRGTTILENAYKAASQLEPIRQVEMWLMAAETWHRAGQVSKAAGLVHQAKTIWEREMSESGRILELPGIVQALAWTGEEQWMTQVADDLEDRFARAKALATISLALAKRGKKERAKEMSGEAKALIGSIDFEFPCVEVLATIALANAVTGDEQIASKILAEAYKLTQSIKLKLLHAKALVQIGQSWAEMGNHVQAEAMLEEAGALNEQEISEPWRSQIIMDVARAWVMLGNEVRAKATLNRTVLDFAMRVSPEAFVALTLAMKRGFSKKGDVASSVSKAFLSARGSRAQLMEWVGYFAQALGALGVLGETWDHINHIQKIEAMLTGEFHGAGAQSGAPSTTSGPRAALEVNTLKEELQKLMNDEGVPAPHHADSKFERFSERARKVMTLAQEEAQHFNHSYIGTEHILLALVREGRGVAAKVLGNLGIELPKVRAAVEFIIGRGEKPFSGEIGLTPRAKRVIEMAVDEARRFNHNYIGTEHLLLGLLREGEGVASGVLESLGVSLDRVRDETSRVLS